MTSRDGAPAWIERFVLTASAPGVPLALDGPAETCFQDALAAVVLGSAENDAFNGLVLAAGLAWREVSVLRAYSHYLRQAGTPFSQDYIAAALIAHPDLARARRPVPRSLPSAARAARRERTGSAGRRAHHRARRGHQPRRRPHPARAAAARARDAAHERVQRQARQRRSFKLDPTGVPELPKPLPMFEIFVTSPRVEGVHLRAGRVARGGIRWSDRREDFRTEILGLMKAQTVKNAVIVPVGAKGGLRRQGPPPADRDALAAEVVACYRAFIGALLELTDNLVDGSRSRPRHRALRRRRSVSRRRGRQGHRDLLRHRQRDRARARLLARRRVRLGRLGRLRPQGDGHHRPRRLGVGEGALPRARIDVQNTPFTVVGIGDMSGDVFGNGMLLSRQLRLVAAFDHRHVFLDPDPDPEASYAERERLFRLPARRGTTTTARCSPRVAVSTRAR